MPELRKDPIIDRWVIIAEDRSKRPSDLKKEKQAAKSSDSCVFCKGNEHMTPPEVLRLGYNGEETNDKNWSIRVVPNKFAALTTEGSPDLKKDDLYTSINGVGIHEVIIETSEHNISLENLKKEQFQNVLYSYQKRINNLKQDERISYILVFKNSGLQGGASLIHPHSQIITLPIIPKLVKEEIDGAKTYYDKNKTCIYCDIITQDQKDQKRVVIENDDFISICPFAPRFGFEMWVLPKKHSTNFEDISKQEIEKLTSILQNSLKKLNMVLNEPPYNFVIHTTPNKISNPNYYHWHIEIIPRHTSIAGFEYGTGSFINPVSPEISAKTLRDLHL